MSKYFEIKKEVGIQIDKISEPMKITFGTGWQIDIKYRYKCPYCQTLDNLHKSIRANNDGEHLLINTSDTCFNCKASYKPQLILKCDFSELRKEEKIKSKSVEIQHDAETSESNINLANDSNSKKQEAGFIKRLIVASFKCTYYLFADRKGNIIMGIVVIIGLIARLFSDKHEEIPLGLATLLVIIAIAGFRNHKIYKSSELKFHQQLGEDCLAGLRDMFNIGLNEKVF
ncbi:MAG TPA: hypothetical protein PK079_06275 [Leptospiraceae bacterium]|nr:hypothetical protein [Leptospiraceae bacterium]HMW07919.1 hypothetical protein [Leptospiraceae bacterium]HMX32055.1 hypothetical protein [Leptospiraceae bacterium]HMY31182.1 hypothetical protein [Leptospiraceae bacterium]HMZ65397.1 hypothetical protein [Leptospiraceae bacterium]